MAGIKYITEYAHNSLDEYTGAQQKFLDARQAAKIVPKGFGSGLAIGESASAEDNSSICIGVYGGGAGDNSIAIGTSSISFSNSVAVGNYLDVYSDVVAIGNGPSIVLSESVGIGANVGCETNKSVIIGKNAKSGLWDDPAVYPPGATAIGYNAIAYNNGISIGKDSISYPNGIALGNDIIADSGVFRVGGDSLTNAYWGSRTNPNWSIMSDERIKENIEDADTEICLTDINRIKVRRFNYKEYVNHPFDTHVTGFIAQEFKEVFPKAVQQSAASFITVPAEYETREVLARPKVVDEQGNTVKEAVYTTEQVEITPAEKIEFEDLLTLDTSQVIYTLVGAVQELTKRIQELEKE